MILNFLKSWYWKYIHGYDILPHQRIEFQLLVLLLRIRNDISNERIYICHDISDMVALYADKFGLVSFDQMNDVLHSIVVHWEHIIIHNDIPLIPVSKENKCAVSAYTQKKTSDAIEKWYVGDYSGLRRELLDFIIDQIRMMLSLEEFPQSFCMEHV